MYYYNQYNPYINCQGQMLNQQSFNPQMMNPQITNNAIMNSQMTSPQMMSNDMMYMPEGNNMMKQMQMEELKMMYPKSYYLIMPHIKQHCDMMENKHGYMYCPTKREIEEIKDEIYKCIDKELDECKDEDESDEKHHDERYEYEEEQLRQRGYGRRQAVRDLIGVALIGELLGRGPFVPYPFYPPYYPFPPAYGYGWYY